jgi:GGDEF domain-containing protein
MGITEARKYITALHKKQKDPLQWPDFLTGLPDRNAIIHRARKKGIRTIAYIRIENINPYLAKYGTTRHVEIIEWASAILRTTAEKYNMFVGTLSKHDFVVIGANKNLNGFLEEAALIFEKKAQGFYNKEDLKTGSIMRFMNEDKEIHLGFMKFIYCTSKGIKNLKREEMILHLEKLCDKKQQILV